MPSSINPTESPAIPQVDWGGWLSSSDTPPIAWYEEMGDPGPNKGSVGLTSTAETLTIIVNWADEVKACSNLIGYHEVGSTTIGGDTFPIIVRHVPKKHPIKQWLYATRVETERLAPLHGFYETTLAADARTGDDTIKVVSNTGFTVNRAVIVGYLSDLPEAQTVLKQHGSDSIEFTDGLLHDHVAGEKVRSPLTMQPFPVYEGTSSIQVGVFYAGAYTVSRLHISFNSLPFTVLTDAELEALDPGALPDETQRYCQIFGVEGGDFLARARGSFKWAEGSGVGGQPTQWSEVDASAGQRLIKPTLTFIWNAVPTDFILDVNFVPTNFRNCEGKLNADTFFGRLPGTLLCLPIKYDPEEQPQDPRILGLPAGYPPRQYKVTVNLAEFDPLKGIPASAYRGWQLAPNPGDNKWYGIIGNDSVTLQYQSASFSTIFQGIP